MNSFTGNKNERRKKYKIREAKRETFIIYQIINSGS